MDAAFTGDAYKNSSRAAPLAKRSPNFPMAGKKAPLLWGASLPCAVIRTESFGEVEQPQLSFDSLKESGAVGIPASDTAEEPEERSNDTKPQRPLAVSAFLHNVFLIRVSGERKQGQPCWLDTQLS